MIKLLRIDDRLIHGQVAFAWTRSVGADYIVVADDDAATNQIRKMSLSLAKPADTKLSIVKVEEAINILKDPKNKKVPIMVIVGNTESAVKISNEIEEVKSICLGGLRPGDGKKALTRAINVTDDDMKNLDRIIEKGIEVEIREVPNSKKVFYKDLR